MKGRFYFDDGRIAEDVTLDERAVRHALVDGKRLRWFTATGERDQTGSWCFARIVRSREERVRPCTRSAG